MFWKALVVLVNSLYETKVTRLVPGKCKQIAAADRLFRRTLPGILLESPGGAGQTGGGGVRRGVFARLTRSTLQEAAGAGEGARGAHLT